MVVEESGGIVWKFALLDSATTDEMIGRLQSYTEIGRYHVIKSG